MDSPSDDHPEADDGAWAVAYQRTTAILKFVLIDEVRLRAPVIRRSHNCCKYETDPAFILDFRAAARETRGESCTLVQRDIGSHEPIGKLSPTGC
jgi:hypothetical protein